MASQTREGGSFLTGFGVGILAGAVGYFLRDTESGEHFRSQFKSQWSLAEVFVKEELKESAPSTVQAAFQEVFAYLTGESTEKAGSKKETSQDSARAKTSRTQKFKGL